MTPAEKRHIFDVFSRHEEVYSANCVTEMRNICRIPTAMMQSIRMCLDLYYPETRNMMGRMFIQKAFMKCMMPVEKEYYNVQGRGFKTKEICWYCGLDSGLLSNEELRQLGKSGGHKKYPMCGLCMEEGKKPHKNGRINQAVAAEEQRLTKAAKAEAKKKATEEKEDKGSRSHKEVGSQGS
jgi:hypothetical protein